MIRQINVHTGHDVVTLTCAGLHLECIQSRSRGEFESWLIVHSAGLDVIIEDPKSRVLQIQGPKSMAILEAATI